MSPRLRPALIASVSMAVLMPLALGGCGGGEPQPEETAPASPSPTTAAEVVDDAAAESPATATTSRIGSGGSTHATFVRRGNRICAEGSAELATIGDSVPVGDQEALLAAIVDQVVPNIRRQVADLRALGYPAGDARVLTGMLDDTDAVLDAWAAAPATAFTDTRMDAINDRLDDYGLTSCGDS